MKALILNGSPHKNGSTAKTLKLIQDKIKGNYDYELIHAYDLNIKPCMGCLKCRPDSECILPRDDGHAIGQKMKEADLLVIGTPSYWSNMPAPLKVIFDRNVSILEYCLDKPPLPNMVGKSALLVVTCASDEVASENDLQFPLLITNLHYILHNSGYTILDTIKVHSSWNFDTNRKQIEQRINKLEIA